MAHKINYHPLAEADLFRLYGYIEEQSGPARAGAFIERIERACRALERYPLRSTPRDDIAPGVRTVAVERRALIALRVEPGEVTILRILYAGWGFSATDVP